MTKPLLLLLLTACFTSAPSLASVPLLDIWIGTIEVKRDEIYLKRCAIGQDMYMLKPLNDDKVLESIPVAVLKRGESIVVTLAAAYHAGDQGKHELLVANVVDVALGETCHLIDILERGAMPDH